MTVDEATPGRLMDWGSASELDWDAIYADQLPRIYNYFRFRLGPGADIEDLTARTFEKAWRGRASYQRDRAGFSTWLFSIAHQKCQQHWRKPRRDEPLPDDAGDEFIAAEELPDDLLVRAEQEEELMALLNQLTEAHRSVLLLHFLEEFSLEEIATVTGVGIGTVKSRLHYAKKSLRALLTERTA